MCFIVGGEEMYDEIGLIPQRLDLGILHINEGCWGGFADSVSVPRYYEIHGRL